MQITAPLEMIISYFNAIYGTLKGAHLQEQSP